MGASFVVASPFQVYYRMSDWSAGEGRAVMWSVGIDLGGTNIAVGLVNEHYEIVGRENAKTRAPRTADSLARTIAGCVNSLLNRHRVKAGDLSALGIGVPGVLDPRTNTLLFAGNLLLENVDLAGLLRSHFPPIPILIGNDADCAAYGEYLAGQAKSRDSALMLTLGTGVGGGFVYNRKIFRGGTGFGIEPGHLVVETEGGVRCTCGQTGCLEAYVSIRGLKRLVEEGLANDEPSIMRGRFHPERPSFNAKIVFDAVRRGDLVASRVVEQYVTYLAMGIRTLVVLYRPHIILLGGGISKAGDPLLIPLREAVSRTTMAGDIIPPPPIYISRLGNDAGIIGAAMLHTQERD